MLVGSPTTSQRLQNGLNTNLIEAATKNFQKLQGIFDRQPELRDVETVYRACQVFEKLERDQDNLPGRAQLLESINAACHRFLVQRGKLGYCSWKRLFGPSYFKQVDRVFQEDSAQYSRVRALFPFHPDY